MPRSHIKLDELRAIAVEINKLLGTPSHPAAAGCYYVEALNDYVSLVQATDNEGGTREVIPSTHRGALLKAMQVLMQGIKLRPQPTNAEDAAEGNIAAIRHIAYAEGYRDGKNGSLTQESTLYRLLPVVEGNEACGAILTLGDDFGDNECTITCQLPRGHEGPHIERFTRDETPVAVLFMCDERPSEEHHAPTEA